ncbi:MAG: hypothetical protein J5649_09025 [Lachnospiraceae bacterium]|nr:hypothetical protein [Lachnospiraceae bacterium]
MHTFFVNTSEHELTRYPEVFEVMEETHRLVSLNCPLAKWNEENLGFKACVNKMGELIDSYEDINNGFNLIVYIDLFTFETRKIFPPDLQERHRERFACLTALRSMLRHYINSTLVKELREVRGSEPQQILIVFDEHVKPDDEDRNSPDGKRLIYENVSKLFHVSDDSFMKFAKDFPIAEEDGELKPEKLLETADGLIRDGADRELLAAYCGQIAMFIQEVRSGADTKALDLFYQRVVDGDADDREIMMTSLVSNRRFTDFNVNKQEQTRRELRLCFFILSCVEDETVLDSGNTNAPKGFPEIDWSLVCDELSREEGVFRRKYKEVTGNLQKYSEIGLAPVLLQLDNERFALDEFGKPGKVLVTSKVDPETKKKETDNRIIHPDGEWVVDAQQVRTDNMLAEKEYELFDYNGFVDDSKLTPKSPEARFLEAGEKLRKNHEDYLSKLKVHVSEMLANYAGRSDENGPIRLKKRTVSTGDKDYEGTGTEYRYARKAKTAETKSLDTVRDISDAAYDTKRKEYLEYCAGREVSVANIEDQHNWYVTRIKQITESLRMIKRIALGMILAMLVIYLPYIVLQQKTITSNWRNALAALGCIGVPLLITLCIVTVAMIIQRRKYCKVWEEFRAKSREQLQQNAASAEAFDRLLSGYIPSLRWIYEYKVDVEFYEDCCKIARAKLQHHSQKLERRAETVKNINQDLVDNAVLDGGSTDPFDTASDKIDYCLSFCSGENNRNFYSIFDKRFIKTIYN